MAKLKMILSLSLILGALSVQARIVQQSENSLGDDFNYKLDQEETEIREIASDDTEQLEEDQNSEEDSERDVASENEKSDMNIKYWKY